MKDDFKPQYHVKLEPLRTLKPGDINCNAASTPAKHELVSYIPTEESPKPQIEGLTIFCPQCGPVTIGHQNVRIELVWEKDIYHCCYRVGLLHRVYCDCKQYYEWIRWIVMTEECMIGKSGISSFGMPPMIFPLK